MFFLSKLLIFCAPFSTHTAIKSRNSRRPLRRKEEPYKVNLKIKAQAVRLVGDNVETAVYTLPEALQLAKQLGLDLVEISPKATPPVCKIIEYTKFKYAQKQKQKAFKAKAQKSTSKEIKLAYNTDTHDLNFKQKHAAKFLQDKHHVKITLRFRRGRERYMKGIHEKAYALLNQFATDLQAYGKIEQSPKKEGRGIVMKLAPLPLKNQPNSPTPTPNA